MKQLLSSLLILLTATPLLAKDAPPNIVFIMADDLGYRELGSYGQEKIKTPRLDGLAAEGMRMMRHYSGSPVCAPSRCVLMTGRHPGNATIRNNSEVKPEGQGPINEDDVTIAELLKARGYATGCFGKWGLGAPGGVGDPLNQGFDRFFGFNCQRHAHSFYPNYLWSDDKRVPLDNNPPVPGHAKMPEDVDNPEAYEKFKGKDYAADHVNAAVLDFIKTNKDKPFYVYYPTLIPHLALHVPDEDVKPYLAEGWEDPPHNARYTPHFTPRAAYAGMITRMDRYVGNVLDLLDELGLADNTLVVFTSDNGATFLGPMAEFFNSVGDLRGLKGQSYEGGLRVPTIVRWPGQVKPGSETAFISGFEDWLPTLMEAVGADTIAPGKTDGVSLLPSLTGKTQQRDWLYREFQGYGGQQALWQGKWKAIRTHLTNKKAAAKQGLQLYDLSVDPGETNDLAAKHPDIAAKMGAIMRSQHTVNPRFPIFALDAEAK